jgi:D-alanyl-lipoteichoic acid acyltransferase DltB (MBOAT superfamily)
MLFNSYEFIFLFLPFTFFTYFYLNKKHLTVVAKFFLVFSSLFFYSWWNIIYLPLILLSMLFNFIIGSYLSKKKKGLNKKNILTIGILLNILLLGYFKYSDFFIENINFLLGSDIVLLQLALPLAISFFTFQQIAYLVDSYKQETSSYTFLDYSIFVTFFPQLIAGPIVHHSEMMPQFRKLKNKFMDYHNIAMGLFIFSIGLFKKVVIADTFSSWATAGFNSSTTLNFFEAWATSLSYTFQLYFDFSGYTDMAIGIALLFNIKLPINFNSPYKSLSIQDFWRRWHITLSRFLRDYIYIPLGGSRDGDYRTYTNLMITFLLGGIWHGAGWTFVFWGFLHGGALVIHRLWKKLDINMYRWLAWFITFNFINIAWVFFRAKEFSDALQIISSMFDYTNIVLPIFLEHRLEFLTMESIKFGSWLATIDSKGGLFTILWLAIGFILILRFRNSTEQLEQFKPNYTFMIWTVIAFVGSVLSLNNVSEFLYFNF